jgi:hypothetical protein
MLRFSGPATILLLELCIDLEMTPTAQTSSALKCRGWIRIGMNQPQAFLKQPSEITVLTLDYM